jgi:hypothetical protein
MLANQIHKPILKFSFMYSIKDALLDAQYSMSSQLENLDERDHLLDERTVLGNVGLNKGNVGLNKSDTVDCNHLASDSIKGMNFSHSAENLQDLQFGDSG